MTDLMTLKWDKRANKQYYYSFNLRLMRRAAMLVFEVRVDEVPLTFRVRTPTSLGVPVNISEWELRNPDFPG